MTSSTHNEVIMSPCHIWGDEDFDWKALDEAAEYLSKNVRRWARLGIWTKEKYGTLRVSTTCAYFTEYDFLHRWVKPGHAWYQWPKWVRQYIDWPFGKVMKWMGVVRLLQKWQHLVLKFFWKRAAKKWPHISEEILDEYSFYFEEEK